MMMKRMILFLVLLSGMLSACAPKTPDTASKELNLYGFSEYIPEDLINGFEEETGVTVNYESYATNEEMLEGLKNNPGKYDLIIPSDYAVEELIANDALLPLELSAIPNYDKIDPAFLNPYFDPFSTSSRRPGSKNEKFTLPYMWGTTGILYDPTKVSEPIASWQDLWRPELAGHLVVFDDSREMMGIALLTLGYGNNETNPARLAEARDKLKELAPGIIAFDAEVPEDYLLSGEAWVGVMYNGNAALAERENPHLVYVLPNEGAGIWFDNMAIPVDAPHPDAAVAFMNYVLEPENGALIVKEYPYSTPNLGVLEYLQENDAEFYEAYIASRASNPPQDALLDATLVKRVDAATANIYEEYWSEVKATK